MINDKNIFTLFSPVSSTFGRKPFVLSQNTCDESKFRKDLQQTKNEHRTSSPTDFKSFIQSSVHADASDFQTSQAHTPLEVKGPKRLLGEIAYQLDRRILSHIFQGHRRLYGFTVVNIPDKIIEVSTHPLTGMVDDGYRLHLTQRYADLMERLNQIGYKKNLHPPFGEFLVNTFGILKDRLGEGSTQAGDYNDPSFLRRLIETTAPPKLQKNLLLLLSCLCYMADMDKRPLIFW
ncbi:speriolin-like protein [Acanthopagrus schlegelii]